MEPKLAHFCHMAFYYSSMSSYPLSHRHVSGSAANPFEPCL